MKNRFSQKSLSFMLACILMVTSSVALFSGCSSSDKYMALEEWLNLINQKFGFSYLLENESYETAVSIDDIYYNDVQLAYAYDVLPSDYSVNSTDSRITNELCALTLAGAIYTSNENEIDIADIAKASYPNEIITIVNEGIMPLNKKGGFDPKKKTEYENAVEYLENAYNSWANRHYDTVVDFNVQENVIDLNGISTYTPYEETRTIINESIKDDSGNYLSETKTVTDYKKDENHISDSQKWLDDNHYSYDKDSGTITLDNISDKNISEGSILALPATIDSVGGTYLKVEAIEDDNGKYKLSVVPAEIEDILGEDFHVSEGAELNLNNAVIRGPDGEILSEGIFAEDNASSTATSMSYGNAVGFSAIKGNITLPIDLTNGFEANITFEGSDLSIGLKKSLYKSSEDKNFSAKKQSSNASISYTAKFSGLTVEADHKGISYAKLALHYKMTHKISFNADASKYQTNLSAEEIADELKKADEASEKTTTFKICSFDVPIKLGDIRITVYGKITAEGSIVVSLECSDCSMGLEARKGHIIKIIDMGTLSSKSITGSAKIEMGPALNIAYCFFNENVIDFEFWAALGLTASAKLTGTRADTSEEGDSHSLHCELSDSTTEIPKKMEYCMMSEVGKNLTTKEFCNYIAPDEAPDPDIDYLFCADLTAYWKIEFSAITSNCRFSKDFKGRIHANFPTYKLTVGGAEVPEWRIIRLHGESCSEKPFDFGKNKCTLADPKSENVEYGDSLDILPNNDIILTPGETAEITITTLPQTKQKYYLLEDLRVSSEDSGIASAKLSYIKEKFITKIFSDLSNIFSKSTIGGKQLKDLTPKIIITAADKIGKTRITLKTKDNKYSIPINVIVMPKDTDENAYMTITLSSFAAPVKIGATQKVDVVNIPEGKTINDVYWESDDTSIATVDPFTGEITGISEGFCTVKAYIIGYEKNAMEISVSVSPDYTANGTNLTRIQELTEDAIIVKKA